MANVRQVMSDRWMAVNGEGKRQSAQGVAQPNEDLDTRIKAALTWEDNVDRQLYYDCLDRDVVDEKVNSRFSRLNIAQSEVDAHELARADALFLGAATDPIGTPADEVQTLTRSGMVSGGTFTAGMTLEGITTVSKAIPYNATAEEIVRILTASNMKFMAPGDIVLGGGQAQAETLTVVGTANADDNLAVTVIAAGSPALLTPGKTINVAIANGDTSSDVAGKIRAAFIADADIGHVTTGFFTITGAGADVILTTNNPAANDTTMEVSYPTALGMTGATSANTTAGIAVGGDWTSGIVLRFAGKLAKANLPLLTINGTALTGGGTVLATQTTPGDQNYHIFTRSATRAKAFISFALGWEEVDDRVEKYKDFVVESVTRNISLDGNVTQTISLLGPYEADSIEEDFEKPPCVSVDALQAQDCRLMIDGVWQTEDINSLSESANDNIPTDRLSAFGFIGTEIQRMERGRQPAYTFNASIFGEESSSEYIRGRNEITEDPVNVTIHYGYPGNRFTRILPKVKIKLTAERLGEAGEARYTTTNIEGQPFLDNTNAPVRGEAYIDQDVAFLVAST